MGRETRAAPAAEAPRPETTMVSTRVAFLARSVAMRALFSLTSAVLRRTPPCCAPRLEAEEHQHRQHFEPANPHLEGEHDLAHRMQIGEVCHRSHRLESRANVPETRDARGNARHEIRAEEDNDCRAH